MVFHEIWWDAIDMQGHLITIFISPHQVESKQFGGEVSVMKDSIPRDRQRNAEMLSSDSTTMHARSNTDKVGTRAIVRLHVIKQTLTGVCITI